MEFCCSYSHCWHQHIFLTNKCIRFGWQLLDSLPISHTQGGGKKYQTLEFITLFWCREHPLGSLKVRQKKIVFFFFFCYLHHIILQNKFEVFILGLLQSNKPPEVKNWPSYEFFNNLTTNLNIFVQHSLWHMGLKKKQFVKISMNI